MQILPLEGLWFNLDLSISCGQAFRWRKHNDIWYSPSPYGDTMVWKVQQTKEGLEYEGMKERELIHYFSLDHNLNKILSHIDCDPVIHDAIFRCQGLRIMRQDPWECLISYICSSCSSIPTIQMRIENLAEKYGKKLTCDNKIFYSFPQPETIGKVPIRDIRTCKVGFRDEYIFQAAEMVCKNPEWSEEIRNLSYQDAKKRLCELKGVGPKIADCVLLFAFEKLEAVPVDVWIERIIRNKYIGGKKKLSYTKAETYAREHFGKFAGYAQEYLYASRKNIT
ncbi:MAG TPA: DNA glycosylase [Methanocorpusculum sp.]|nr:DNA glycosylase [Methanocorpusculum sp.]